jgi:hypothetical protein
MEMALDGIVTGSQEKVAGIIGFDGATPALKNWCTSLV